MRRMITSAYFCTLVLPATDDAVAVDAYGGCYFELITTPLTIFIYATSAFAFLSAYAARFCI